ncbi:MAG: LytTR family DNA-binding domain-containing protein [Acetatifactor sp.]|nr:LytTR family DNA-binding domain-containing protein [Acetatifactor sp.]
MYNIGICDDEQAFAMELEEMIGQYARETGTEIRTTLFQNGRELSDSEKMELDLIFLDIQMDVMNGLEAAKRIRERDGKVGIIFLTSLTKYALAGYEYQAVNYVVKPIKYVRLKRELDRWLETCRREDKKYILVTNEDGRHRVDLCSLRYLETYNRNVKMHTDGGEIISYKKMKELEEELKDAHFIRCHSGYLVNPFFVKRVGKLEITLTDGEIIPISQPKRKMVMEKLTDYWGDRL